MQCIVESAMLYAFPTAWQRAVCLTVVLPDVRPLLVRYSVSRDPVTLGEQISVKLSTNIHHVSGHCFKGFQIERSEVKVMSKPINLKWRMTEAYISTV